MPVTRAIPDLAEAFSLACMQLVRPVMYSLSTVFRNISSGFFLPGLSRAVKLIGKKIRHKGGGDWDTLLALADLIPAHSQPPPPLFLLVIRNFRKSHRSKSSIS